MFKIYLFIYNIIQLLLLFILWPLLALWALKAKYRDRVLARLGINLPKPGAKTGSRIWVHALSVGEVASAIPLITAIKRDIPTAEIIFSTTTRSGRKYARNLDNIIDHFVPLPFDIFWIVNKFIRRLQPDLFILIETDFWPNILWQMQSKKIPTLLANGRITTNSFKNYRRASFLFGPLFNSFSFLSMQIKIDAMRMIDLGVSAEKVVYCGNLKYDLEPFKAGNITKAAKRHEFNLPPKGKILIAGSTHPGEEEIIINSYLALLHNFSDLNLIIAPRDINRGSEIADMLKQNKIKYNRRSQSSANNAAVLILDTLGELSTIYTLADLVFIGGSLVAQGGHNPIEPAIFAKAIVFGSHMEDFAEISRTLLDNRAAVEVSAANFTSICHTLLADNAKRHKLGVKATDLVNENQGASRRYIKIIQRIINHAQQKAN